MTDVLQLLDRAHAAHREEAVHATVTLLTELLARKRQVREIRIKPGVGAVLVTMEDATIRLAMPSTNQSKALRDLWRRGPVMLAMGIALDDGRAMLGFSGVDEDVLITTRIGRGTV
jgi:hypothetical protein